MGSPCLPRSTWKVVSERRHLPPSPQHFFSNVSSRLCVSISSPSSLGRMRTMRQYRLLPSLEAVGTSLASACLQPHSGITSPCPPPTTSRQTPRAEVPVCHINLAVIIH